ncbi:response regulator [Vibrio salinus]|uniref:response regulator n=1 Tax=Vibrio salinus TaxID=2899784 RepID=UPI001E5343D8|nr:response regulator [Vibrio salinus]MCE0496149.1 response regulator [Vibrio salinus]
MKKVLIVEDDDSLRDSLCAALEYENFEVECDSSVETALARLKEENFDVILLDIMLGEISGIDGITLFKYLQPGVAIIIMTAFATVDLAVNAMKKGADEFLTKPFDIDTLVVTLKKVVQKYQPKSVKSERDDDLIFSALANPIRRSVIKQLRLYHQVKFMDLCRLVDVDDHTKFNFHLRQLVNCGIVKKLNHKEYTLTALGKDICSGGLMEF